MDCSEMFRVPIGAPSVHDRSCSDAVFVDSESRRQQVLNNVQGSSCEGALRGPRFGCWGRCMHAMHTTFASRALPLPRPPDFFLRDVTSVPCFVTRRIQGARQCMAGMHAAVFGVLRSADTLCQEFTLCCGEVHMHASPRPVMVGRSMGVRRDSKTFHR